MGFFKRFERSRKYSKWVLAHFLGASFLLSQGAGATVVQFQTVLGNFEVNLFDKSTPKTVKNFLTYVEANAYANSIIHRAIPGFVIQGGGYTYQNTLPLVTIPKNPSVENEPVYSNLRGTIAMAKVNGQPNSASSQWFINLSDRNATDKEYGYVLDANNDGFTVFGQVIGNGMQVVDAIAALNRFNMGTGFDTVPLRNYSASDAAQNEPVTGAHFTMVHDIVILNADPDTAVSLTPVKNTQATGKGGGGGSTGLVGLAMLALLALTRKRLLNRG